MFITQLFLQQRSIETFCFDRESSGVIRSYLTGLCLILKCFKSLFTHHKHEMICRMPGQPLLGATFLLMFVTERYNISNLGQ